MDVPHSPKLIIAFICRDVSAVDCSRRTSFFVRCYSLISLSVPSIAARLAATRFAASRCPNGCFRRSSSRDPKAHPAPRQIANRSCPSVGVGGNRGLPEKHPTQPHRSDLALAVHFGTREHVLEMIGAKWAAIFPLCVASAIFLSNSNPAILAH